MTVSHVISQFIKINFKNLLQPSAHTETSECFSIIIFEDKIVVEQKQA